MRLKRRWSPGGTDFFSSAASLSLPVGSRFKPGEVRGYYIDFVTKADRAGWPPVWLAERDAQFHVGTIQWALGCYERYLGGDGEEWREAAIGAADYLVGDQEPDGGWPHLMPMPHTYRLQPPWLSAMAQGEGASLLVRAQLETGDDRYGDAALRALRPMGLPTSDGGLRVQLDGQPFLEEYPTSPSSYVLNGAIFALWGYYDVGVGLGERSAMSEFERCVAGLAATVHRFDNGFWSLYDLYPHPISNVASGAYHALHINQLRSLSRIAPSPEFGELAARFEAYLGSRRNRVRAFAHKAAFRLMLPRNETAANLMPFGKRVATAGRGGGRRRRGQDHLVLCYHAVSESWSASLSVTPEGLTEQLEHLVERGYRGIGFHEAVHGDLVGKTVAITFDDGYRSVIELALPIMERLSLPGTVFATTAFVGSERPMAWPGIDGWLGTESESELTSMSWAELRALAERGWEIGSHTRTHPRLPALDDDALMRELADSKRECEEALERPCQSIAYPYGAHDPRVLTAVREAGYASGGTLPARLHPPSPLRWPRIGIYHVDDPLRFRMKVWPAGRALRSSAAWGAAIRLRGAVSG